jgi:hypothetical protein
MPSTFSPNKGYELQATGENAGLWGAKLNSNFISLVDVALGGQTSLTLSGSNVTLDSVTQAPNVSLRLNGMLGANITVTNPNKGFYVAENLTTGAFSVSVSNGVGSPAVLPQNSRTVLFADATNGVRALGTAGATTPDAFPIGTQMLFAQAAVPTGWSLSAALNDYAIKVSSTAGGATSGALAFSVVFNLQTTDPHTLTLAETPIHVHTYTAESRQGNGSSGANPFWAARDGAGENYGNLSATSTSSGGGTGHSHNADMRIKAMTTIIGTRAA